MTRRSFAWVEGWPFLLLVLAGGTALLLWRSGVLGDAVIARGGA